MKNLRQVLMTSSHDPWLATSSTFQQFKTIQMIHFVNHNWNRKNCWTQLATRSLPTILMTCAQWLTMSQHNLWLNSRPIMWQPVVQFCWHFPFFNFVFFSSMKFLPTKNTYDFSQLFSDHENRVKSNSSVSLITDNLMHGWACVKRGVQQPPVLHNNRACCPHGVATQSQHFCEKERRANVLGTARSRTGEFRMTSVHPLRHWRQQDDIFRLPQTAPGMFRLCVSPHQRVLPHPSWLPLPRGSRASWRHSQESRLWHVARSRTSRGPSAATSSRQLVEILQTHVADDSFGISPRSLSRDVEWTATPAVALWQKGVEAKTAGETTTQWETWGNFLWAQWSLFGLVWETPNSKTILPPFSHSISNTKSKVVFYTHFEIGVIILTILVLKICERKFWSWEIVWSFEASNFFELSILRFPF